MDNFNMKQWLQENKVGPYSKTLLNEMNPAAMDVMAERGRKGVRDGFLEKLDDIQLTHNGEEYDIVIEAPYEYTVESDTDPRAHPDDPSPGTVFDIDIVRIAPKILELYKLQGGEYVPVEDQAEIQEVEAALVRDEAAMKRIENFIRNYDIDLENIDDDYEDDRYEPDMEETVGYVMKTKKSDSEQEF